MASPRILKKKTDGKPNQHQAYGKPNSSKPTDSQKNNQTPIKAKANPKLQNLLHSPLRSFAILVKKKKKKSFAIDLGFITLAISITSSSEMLPLCLMFFVFFRSCSGSFNALMTSATATEATRTPHTLA